MVKNSEAVSLVINSLRLTNRDERISKRFILHTLRSVAKLLISQKMLDRTLQRETNIFSRIECFEFQKENLKKCNILEFRRCDILMKSVKKLPEPIFSRLGASIQDVVALDGNFNFTFVTIQQYQRNKKRKHSLNGEVYIYLGEDGHLYIPDYEIKSLDLALLTMETDKLEECSSCTSSNCKSGYDYNFICPDKLLNVVYTQVIQLLGGTFRAITPDENPNNVERQ